MTPKYTSKRISEGFPCALASVCTIPDTLLSLCLKLTRSQKIQSKGGGERSFSFSSQLLMLMVLLLLLLWLSCCSSCLCSWSCCLGSWHVWTWDREDRVKGRGHTGWEGVGTRVWYWPWLCWGLSLRWFKATKWSRETWQWGSRGKREGGF